MTHQYAFYVDLAACSGCKACQVACKDKHGLEVGRLWRRVYEVTGGGWQADGAAWRNDVFAYHLSISCNHCEKPICLSVCPAQAIYKRPDGIVLIDPQRCLGCKLCSWACPYGAPQYDEQAGVMTKCTFCADELDAGRPPACVAACPLRALDFGELTELQARYPQAAKNAASPFPLPDPAQTGPSLLVNAHPTAPHAGDQPGGAQPHGVENREEVGLR